MLAAIAVARSAADPIIGPCRQEIRFATWYFGLHLRLPPSASGAPPTAPMVVVGVQASQALSLLLQLLLQHARPRQAGKGPISAERQLESRSAAEAELGRRAALPKSGCPTAYLLDHQRSALLKVKERSRARDRHRRRGHEAAVMESTERTRPMEGTLLETAIMPLSLERMPQFESESSESPASSGLTVDDNQSTDTLLSSDRHFPTENGRQYHRFREGSYLYPNDDVEVERMDLHYELMRMAMGGREFFAPLSDPTMIMDIGTGTGMWPMVMSEIFPNCKIIGTDLSPIQPGEVPPNVQFVVDDMAEDDWLYPLDHFDFIHTRVLLGCFEDFRDVVKRSYRYLKPGGWMESQEFMTTPYCDDGTMHHDWPYAEWARTIEEAAMVAGRPLRIANKLKRWYKEAGFVDVHEEVFKVPVNPWPKDPHAKDLGKICEMDALDGIQGFSLAVLHRGMGWTKNEIEVYLVNVRKAIKDRSVHAYHKV
ncbi:MAG: hypothetical protein M1826_001027 [Phylliscum demangeonii]|nr:MAG: hypothetical protein M1826_001027 [Phylliscum demangeonii]